MSVSDGPLTPTQVRRRVKEISDQAADDGEAHRLEDRLHVDVLSAIAEGRTSDPEQCAFEALRTDKIDFSRWYE